MVQLFVVPSGGFGIRFLYLKSAQSFMIIMSSGIREKSLTRLAKDILAKAEAIDEYFENSEAPYPSLEQENGADLSLTGAPPDVMAARVSLINQCTEIRELLTDPIDSITLLTLPVSAFDRMRD